MGREEAAGEEGEQGRAGNGGAKKEPRAETVFRRKCALTEGAEGRLEEMGVKVSARKKGATHLVYGEHDRSEAVAEVLKGFQTGSGVVLVHEDALQKLIEDYFLQQVTRADVVCDESLD